MGWNNWNTFACSVSSTLLTSTAQLLTEYGLQDLGYNFPGGMAALADVLHEKGFLFGMYSSAGEMTCARYAGSLDHEEADAASFASWGVDYLKYDNCYHKGRFGTPLISLCSWGEDYVHTWGGSIANSWRTTSARAPTPGTHCSVLAIVNKVAPYIDRGLPGGWNDLDMLEVGHGGMIEEEYKAHFSMWAALKSPLLLGNDLRTMSPSTLTIITKPSHHRPSTKTPRGRAVQRISRNTSVPRDGHGIGETHVWSGPPSPTGTKSSSFLNAADADLDMAASLKNIFVMDGVGGTAARVRQDWAVHDLWGEGGAGMMRMEDARRVVDAEGEEARRAVLRGLGWYNATEVSYAEGLRRRDPRLGGEVFRLQSVSGEDTVRKSLVRDEL
ncbi:glycoside hydrolase family 27 protein [Trichoderma gracile]